MPMKVLKLQNRIPICPETKLPCGRKCLGLVCIRALEGARASKARRDAGRAKQ